MKNAHFARAVSVAACFAAAAIVSPSFAGGNCAADVNGDLVVDADDLLEVIDAWGPCSGSCPADVAPGSGDGFVGPADLFAVNTGWGECDGSPGGGGTTPSGPIQLHSGANTINNFAITGTAGINGGNNTHVTNLIVRNCTINVANAGIYASPCDQAVVRNTHIVAAGGINPYSVRGQFNRWVSRDNVFHGNKAWRIYDLHSGSSTRDVFTGGRMLLGGGAANEWVGALDFDNFFFRDGSISVDSVEVHAASNNILFDNMDFTGTDHISIHGPAHHITFRNCTRNGQPVTQNHVGGNTNFIRLHNNPTSIQVTP